jgi:flagellar motility protein MotE (MotC chaperone)
MKKVLSLLAIAFTYFCIATVISAAAVGITLGAKGVLTESRIYRVLAALHGLDVVTLHKQIHQQQLARDAEQPSFQQQQDARLRASLDLDIREKAVRKGIIDLTSLQNRLQNAQEQFGELTKAYERRLDEIQQQEQSAALQELLITIEAMKPEQAKDQIMKMLDDNALAEVVALLKKMSMDKRKKLLGEFETPQEADRLYEVLKSIRDGEPLASEIQEAREKLRPFTTPQTPATE